MVGRSISYSLLGTQSAAKKGFQRTKRFAKINEAKTNRNFCEMRKFCENHESFIALTINCSKELVEFSALIAQYLKLSLF